MNRLDNILFLHVRISKMYLNSFVIENKQFLTWWEKITFDLTRMKNKSELCEIITSAQC